MKTLNFRQISRIVFILGNILMATGCEFFAETKVISSSQTTSNLIGGLGPGTVGIKNANQVSLSMSRVTGIDANESFSGGTPIREHASIIKGWLSGDGTVESLNSTMLLTITGLAGNYCRRFIEKEAAITTTNSRKAHAGVNFSGGVAGLTPTVVDATATKYHELFLRRSPSSEELKMIREETDLAATSVQATTLSNSEKVQRALLVPCTAILGGLEFVSL